MSARISTAWELTLPWPRPPLTQNQRLHWVQRNRLNGEIKRSVFMLAAAAKLPRGLDEVMVTLIWHPAVRRKRDEDNLAPTLKAAIDGLVKDYGLCVDDDSSHVHSAAMIDQADGRHSRLWLLIEHLR